MKMMAKKKKIILPHSTDCNCVRCKPTYVEPILEGSTYESLYENLEAISLEQSGLSWYVNAFVQEHGSLKSTNKRFSLDEWNSDYSFWTNNRSEMLERRARLQSDPRFK